MDIEPLLDEHAPRYAVESDSEDEIDNDVKVSQTSHTRPNIALTGHVVPCQKLLVASGYAGMQWWLGSGLHDALGGINVGSHRVGSTYAASSTCVVAHIDSIIPPSICYGVAVALLSAFAPAEVAVLDSYTASTYISDIPLSPYNAPMRYLGTTTKTVIISKGMMPFTPPNLLQSFPGALMTALEIAGVAGAIVQLPASFVPLPPKQEPLPLDALGHEPWSDEDLTVATGHLSALLGLSGLQWSPSRVGRGAVSLRSTRQKIGGVVGEGSMYI